MRHLKNNDLGNIVKNSTDLIGHDRRVAVRNVRKRAGVHKHGRALHRLHQRRVNRVLHQHGDGAGDAEVVHVDRLARLGEGANHLAKARLHVGETGGEREHGHDLGRHGNVIVGRARLLFLVALPDRDLAQEAIVDVDHAIPVDLGRVWNKVL